MRKTLSLALAAAIASGSVMSAGAASAQHYYRGGHYYGHHRGNGGAAVVAGIAGLAIGAALASNSHPHYYGRPYYRESYYAGPSYAPGYYDYGPGYADCRTERVWDPYIGRWITRSHCW